MSSKQTYVATECEHENVIEFGSDDDVFERRTIGCNTCGTTSEHVRSDLHTTDNEVESGFDESVEADMARDVEENEEVYQALADTPDGDEYIGPGPGEHEDVNPDGEELFETNHESEERHERLDLTEWADDADYFDELQPVAKRLGITANQSGDDLRDAILNEDQGEVRDAIQVNWGRGSESDDDGGENE